MVHRSSVFIRHRFFFCRVDPISYTNQIDSLTESPCTHLYVYTLPINRMEIHTERMIGVKNRENLIQSVLQCSRLVASILCSRLTSIMTRKEKEKISFVSHI